MGFNDFHSDRALSVRRTSWGALSWKSRERETPMVEGGVKKGVMKSVHPLDHPAPLFLDA